MPSQTLLSPLIALLILTACCSLRAEEAAPPPASGAAAEGPEAGSPPYRWRSARQDWESRAEARIAEHRQGDFTIQLFHDDGRPAAGARVRVEQTAHAFPFGSALSAASLVDPGFDPRYREQAAALFNRAALENFHKWRWQENPRDIATADAAIDWLRARGMSARAHAMVWASFKYGTLPKDVKRRLQEADDRAAGEYAHRRAVDHARAVGRRYRGRIDEWDVINEHHSEHAIAAARHPETPIPETPNQLDYFRAAREADPAARLYVNDFGILVGDQTEHKDSYERQIRYLLDNGAPLGGIGMQAHYANAWQTRRPEQLLDTLDRFAAVGPPIQITEFDMWGEGWGDTREEVEAAQADYLRQFYIACFSHPAVNGISMWGFWDGLHWTDNAPLFREDWSPKPALAIYRELVFGRWWTSQKTLTTDEEGRAAFRGFYGDYRATAEHEGESTVLTPRFDRRGPVATYRLPR